MSIQGNSGTLDVAALKAGFYILQFVNATKALRIKFIKN